jgi:putative GTP pyrophosphokinase
MSGLRDHYEFRAPLLELLAKALKGEVDQALDGMAHIDRVSFRAKGTASFLGKAASKEYLHPLVEIEDQVAGRVLVFFLEDIDLVVQVLKKLFTEVESKRREPKDESAFGYESHHLVCMIPPHVEPNGWSAHEDMPKTFELQVRTLFMHAWAEPQHDIGYKPDLEIPKDIQREWAWAAASAWGADRAFQRAFDWYRSQQLKGTAKS